MMTARPGNPDLAESIIRATADIVEERGPEGVTMRAVADRIGYSPTTIYLYFENKDDLLRQTLIRAYELMTSAIDDAGGTPQECLVARAEAYVRWAMNHPGIYRFMYQSEVLVPRNEEEWGEWVHGWDATRDLIAQGIAGGDMPARDDVAAAATVHWAAVHGISMLAISGRLVRPGSEASPAEIEERALHLARTFVSMCFAEPQTA